MQKVNVLLVFGTRPEAIKMAPVYHELKKNSDFFNVTVCVTAQHRKMLDQVLSVFNIIPDIDLNLMKSGQDLYDVTCSVILAMRGVIETIKPDLILIHGDTTTTLATAMASFYSNSVLGHIEAGLRTYDMNSPYPEEFNRQVVTKVAKWHFAPTTKSKQNLLNENICENQIVVTGNTVIDALLWVEKKINSDRSLKERIFKELSGKLNFHWQEQRYVLITGHRRESFGLGFINICEAIKVLSLKYPLIQFVYPVHFNPNVQNPVQHILSGLKNVHLIEPLEYEEFFILLKNSYIILTDSGGIQEEAPTLGKPVIVMRESTERHESVVAGLVRLVGTDKEKIVTNVGQLIDNEHIYLNMTTKSNPYGDGTASEKIVSFIRSNFVF